MTWEEQRERAVAIFAAKGIALMQHPKTACPGWRRAHAILRGYSADRLSDIADPETINLILDRWEHEL